MITSIEGTLAGSGVDWVEIAIGGVTVKASVPHSAVERLGQRGERVRLFTSLQVRDDSMTLFGFPTDEARSAFEALTAVNGVGPRGALSVLSDMGPETLALAVDQGDTNAFKAVHGVGTKTANRIVLELKGKLDIQPLAASTGRPDADLVDALTALGYTVPEVMQAISLLPSDDSLSFEERVRLSLQSIGGR